MRSLMMDLPLSVAGALTFAERQFPERQVVYRASDGRIASTRWSDLAVRSRRIATALLNAGIRPGDRVATLGMNHPDHVAVLFAVAGIGAVAHTVNPRLSVDDVGYLLRHAEARIVVCDVDFFNLVALAVNGVEPSPRLFVFGDDPVQHQTLSDLIADVPPIVKWPTLDERDAAALCYTSGTTGRPKGVLYSHRSAMLHAMYLTSANGFGIGGTDVVLPLVPLFHACAWGLPFAAALSGAGLALPGHRLDGPAVQELTEAAGVTVAAGVPTVWTTLFDHLTSSGRAVGRLRLAAIGGSTPSPALLETIERRGVEVYHGWGMTEVSPLGTSGRLYGDEPQRPIDDRLAIKATQGRTAFGTEMRLLDDEGEPVASGAGHLEVRGLWTCAAYFGIGETEGSHSPDGWFRTGDVARFDDEGRLVITDRAKDVIKSGGEWISSIEVETAALLIPGILQAACIAEPHPQWQERPLLIVVSEVEIGADEVRRELVARLPRWQVPDRIIFAERLPVGATGKVLKAALRDRYVSSSDGRNFEELS